MGVTEIKITNSNENTGLSNIPGYVFEHVPTPLACGGVGLFVDETLSYSVLEKTSTESFQALWIEISFVKKKNVICGVLYRQHNSPESFLKYLEETIDKFTSTGKNLCLLGNLIYVYKNSKPVITVATSYWLFKVVISFQLLTNQHVFTKILQA